MGFRNRAELNHAVKHCCVALAQRSRLCDLITTQMGINHVQTTYKGLDMTVKSTPRITTCVDSQEQSTCTVQSMEQGITLQTHIFLGY